MSLSFYVLNVCIQVSLGSRKAELFLKYTEGLVTRGFGFPLREEQNSHQVIRHTKFSFRWGDSTFNNSVISVSIAICWVSYTAASAKFTVMADGSPLKQTNSSQDLCVEKRLQISRFISDLVFSPTPIRPNIRQLRMLSFSKCC